MNIYHRSPWMTVAIAETAEAKASSRTLRADIRIDGTVGSYDYGADTWKEARRMLKDAVRKELAALAAMKVDEIVVEIASLGGSFQHAMAIHDYLAMFPGRVVTRVIGTTASAATIIHQAGNVREMSANALYLIHRSANGGWGNFHALTRAAAAVNEFDGRMASIYAKRSRKSDADMLAVMDEGDGQGAWMTAERAKELGLVDDIFEPMDAAAAASPPDADILAEAGLPPLPGMTPDEDDPEQTPATGDTAAQTAGTATAAKKKTASKGRTTGATKMKLTKEQAEIVKQCFGADLAFAAVTEELTFEAALERGSEKLATAHAETVQQMKTVTAERDTLKAEKQTLEKQLRAAKAGIEDPLGTNESPAGRPAGDETAGAKAKKEQEAQAEAKKDEGTRAAFDGVFGAHEDNDS